MTGCRDVIQYDEGCKFYDEPPYNGAGWTVFVIFQALLTCLGLLFNGITAVTLQLNNDGFPAVTKVLYQHQACLDFLICVMGLGIILQPCLGQNTGIHAIDHFLCHVWHGQAFYWTWVLISIWNIVYISFERFGMIHYPIRHRNASVKYLCRGFCIIYALSFLFLIPEYFQVKYDETDGKCYDEYYFKTTGWCGAMKIHGVFWFIISYALPIIIFMSLYMVTVCKLRAHQREQSNVFRNAVYKRTNDHITRSAIAITICFVISQSTDAWAYLLNRSNIYQNYARNSPQQTTMLFLTTLNSCINPIIYCVSLAPFRVSLRKTFRRGFLTKYIDPPSSFLNRQEQN